MLCVGFVYVQEGDIADYNMGLALRRHVLGVLRQAKMTWHSVLHFRVHYTGICPSKMDIYIYVFYWCRLNGWCVYYAALEGVDVPITFVPVEAIAAPENSVTTTTANSVTTTKLAIQVIAYNGELMETDLWLAKQI
ncbi:hypothetical protein AaE_006852 [Aphanomyces astaci]|uniref:Uncharacterized protein n=1 Tax=Aphanomyces astaci TaxID=112090 RepID=A0A6A4ZZ36_APHAT|nr:hypothetical protein AaE_006852 [Aphanomyces astaci]